ncbi:xylan 1,4-beta-xylosidase [Microbispora corallina]|uniref:xylan 1,4-beta-xylosidase n=1 Tax=Microbispora corallina TaxID=83302 RepID=UPI001EF213B4|nr:xylan 1,4-beta-xylosidase [Microbispora corallina]
MGGRRGRHARGRRSPRWPVAVALLALAVVCAGAILGVAALRRDARQESPSAAAAARVTPLTVSRTAEPVQWPRWGLTHTQYTPGDDERVAGPAVRALAAQPLVQNQHVMGFGADNPEPRPGVFDFASLDARVKLMADTGGAPVLTLCCAPDWMKGGRPGKTDWSLIETAPRQEHFDDFARLAAAVARRYPHVRRFIVWNEFKGMWDDRHGEWNAVAYTELYNRVYDALKAVDPGIQVGGPYIPVDTYVSGSPSPSEVSGPWGSVDGRVVEAVDYWLRHKKGADFVVVDGAAASHDGSLKPDEFGALGKFGAVTRWLRQRSGLPVWWAEFYPLPCSSIDPGGSCPALQWTGERRVAVTAAALMELAAGGAETALYWDTYAPRDKREGCPLCLVSSDDGAPTATLRLLQDFAHWFPAGTPLVPVTVSSPVVRALAQEHRIVAVNTTGDVQAVSVDGGGVTLQPYEVRWMDPAGGR